MRIKGPGDGPRPTEGVDETAPVEDVGDNAPVESGAVARVGGTGGPTGSDPIAQVAARLRAGEISADEAVELLIDDAIERQMGGGVRKELEPKLRQVLRDYAANDPYLSAKLRRLTQGK